MKAKCTYYGKCSGCTLQQFPYVKQIHDKSRRITGDLAPLLPAGVKAEAAIKGVKPSPLEHGYRTSGKLCLHEDDLGRRLIGLYERGSKKVVSIPDCTVHHPEINRLVERLFGFGKTLPAPLYQHNKKGFQAGRLKFVIIRYSPETREFGLVLSHTGITRAALEAWAKTLDLRNIALYETALRPEDGDLVMARECSHIGGMKTFRFQIGARVYNIDPIAFFQANHGLASDFIETIAAGHQGRILLDLYGGFGTYSFAAGDHFEKRVVVEANPHSIASADEFRTREGKTGVETHALSVEDFLKTYSRSEKAKVSDIIINPPRTGITRTVIEGLRSEAFQSLERLTYVSCDPVTLKRDLKELVRGGVFAIREVLPFDMFPQTEHLETVVRLVRARGLTPASPSAKDRRPNSSPERPSPRSGAGNRSGRSPSPRGASRSGTPGRREGAPRKFRNPQG